MIKLEDILEGTASLHPYALHVSPVKVDGKTKYHVKAVGKNLAHGIEPGEHLNDTQLDDAQEMGAKIKHIKEAAEGWKIDSTHKHPDGGTTVKVKHRDGAVQMHTNKNVKTLQKLLQQRYDVKMPTLAEDIEIVDEAKEEVELQEGALAHSQFQQYHNDSAKLLKGIGSALSKHYDNVTNKKSYMGGEAHWGHVGDVKEIHRNLQDLHDRILQAGEYAKPVKLGERVEPEADMNILVQLRKPIDILEHGTQGGADVTFGDGQKVFVEGTVAQKLVESMEKIKPEDRVKVAEFLYQSHDNMMAVYARLN